MTIVRSSCWTGFTTTHEDGRPPENNTWSSVPSETQKIIQSAVDHNYPGVHRILNVQMSNNRREVAFTVCRFVLGMPLMQEGIYRLDNGQIFIHPS